MGEVSVLDHSPRSASIVALTECVTLQLSIPQLRVLSDNEQYSFSNKLNRFLTNATTSQSIFSTIFKNLTKSVTARIVKRIILFYGNIGNIVCFI